LLGLLVFCLFVWLVVFDCLFGWLVLVGLLFVWLVGWRLFSSVKHTQRLTHMLQWKCNKELLGKLLLPMLPWQHHHFTTLNRKKYVTILNFMRCYVGIKEVFSSTDLDFPFSLGRQFAGSYSTLDVTQANLCP
jgi:hypothetical protein